MKERKCLCGMGEECSALSAAFLAIDPHDGRASFSSMPRKIRSASPESANTEHLLITNQLLRAYARHMGMKPGGDGRNNNGQRQYIANHHFHPHFVSEYTIASSGGACKLPPFINEEFLNEGSNFGLTKEDRVLDESGKPTGEYFLVPNYSMEEAKEDLQRLERVNHKMNLAKNRFRRHSANNYEDWSNRSDPLERGHSRDSQSSWRSLQEDSKDMKALKKKNRSLSDTKRFLDNLIEDADNDEASAISVGDIESLETLSNDSFDDSYASDEENKFRPSFLDPEFSSTSIHIKSEKEMLSDNHTNLQRAEAKRNGIYQQRVEATRMKITAALEVLKSGKQELLQAERLIIGSARAAKAYAEGMEAMLRGDEGNENVNDYEREFEDDNDSMSISSSYTSATTISSSSSSTSSSSSSSSSSSFNNTSLRRMGNSSQFPEDQFVDLLCASHSVICSHYSRYAERILGTIAYEVVLFREELVMQIDKLLDTATRLDNLAGTVLFQFEPDIVHAWDQYIAKKILRDKSQRKQVLQEQNGQSGPLVGSIDSPLRPLHYKSSNATASPKSAESDPGTPKKTQMLSKKSEKEPDEDLWLAQMPYLTAAYQQTRTWSRFLYELENVFDEIVDVEAERRARLQELLLEFVPRQRRLANEVVSVLRTPFLQELATRHSKFTGKQVENEIQRVIKSRKIRQPIINRCSNPRPGPEHFQLAFDALDSPVNSSRVVAAKVLERKILKHQRHKKSKLKTKSAWQASLAVVTADSFLHLFDLPCVVDDPSEAARNEDNTEQEKSSGMSFQSITSLAKTLPLNVIEEGECEDEDEQSKYFHQLFHECEYDVQVPITSDGLLLSLKNREGTVVFDGYCKPSHGEMGPAERNKLIRNKGDTVVAINGINTVGLEFPDVVNLIHLTLEDSTRKTIKFRFEDTCARASIIKSLEPNQAFDAVYLGRDPTEWLKKPGGIHRALEQLEPSQTWYLPACEIKSKTNEVFGEILGVFELSTKAPPPQINLPFNVQIPHLSSFEMKSEDGAVKLPFNVQLPALKIQTKKIETKLVLLRAGSPDGRTQWIDTLLKSKTATSLTTGPVEI